jgi:hypothetical protein
MYAKRMTSDGEAVILLNITSTVESSHQRKGKPAIWLSVAKN